MPEQPRLLALVACAASKGQEPAPARILYRSPLFRSSLQYAEDVLGAKAYILSAKHGLVVPDEVITPYNLTLNTLPMQAVRVWADSVALQLTRVSNPDRDQFVVLAGARYRKHLLPHLHHTTVPMADLGIGLQLQWLRRAIESGITDSEPRSRAS